MGMFLQPLAVTYEHNLKMGGVPSDQWIKSNHLR